MRPKEVAFILDGFKERVVNLYSHGSLSDLEKDKAYKIIYLKYLRLLLAEIRDTSSTATDTSLGHRAKEEPIESSIPRHMRRRRKLPDGIVV